MMIVSVTEDFLSFVLLAITDEQRQADEENNERSIGGGPDPNSLEPKEPKDGSGHWLLDILFACLEKLKPYETANSVILLRRAHEILSLAILIFMLGILAWALLFTERICHILFS
jgi:hypothetical protein